MTRSVIWTLDSYTGVETSFTWGDVHAVDVAWTPQQRAVAHAENMTITGSLRVIGPVVLAPATVSVLGLGIGLVLDTEAWDFVQLWVQLVVLC